MSLSRQLAFSSPKAQPPGILLPQSTGQNRSRRQPPGLENVLPYLFFSSPSRSSASSQQRREHPSTCSVHVALLLNRHYYLLHFSAGKTEVRKCQKGADSAVYGKGVRPSRSTLSLVALSHGSWLFLLPLEHLRSLPCPLPTACLCPKAAAWSPRAAVGSRLSVRTLQRGSWVSSSVLPRSGSSGLWLCPHRVPRMDRNPLIIRPTDMDLSSPCVPHTGRAPGR